MKNENRWKQRFANFEKAYTFFVGALKNDTSKIEHFYDIIFHENGVVYVACN
jgi:hypothetical protein